MVFKKVERKDIQKFLGVKMQTRKQDSLFE